MIADTEEFQDLQRRVAELEAWRSSFKSIGVLQQVFADGTAQDACISVGPSIAESLLPESTAPQ
jgi:hypothetical protein